MTGAELVPLGKAVVGAAHGSVAEDRSEKERLAEIAKDTPAMRQAAESYAKRLAIKQAVLLKLYAPLAKWAGASQAYFEDEFASDMAGKIADIPEENLTSPKPSIAVPTMQGLGYSLDEPDLKDMYLHLLATATDNRRSDGAHPSFAEVIKQLSGAEAKLLSSVLRLKELTPAGEAKRMLSDGSGYAIEIRHLLDVRRVDTNEPLANPLLGVWIDNWIRLGLVKIDYGHIITSPSGRYDWLDYRPEVKSLRAALKPGERIDFNRGVLLVNDFGRRFAYAVGADAEQAK